MILAIELMFIILLAAIFYMLYRSDIITIKNRLPHAVVKEYWDGDERRKHVRFKKNLEVVYTIIKEPGSNANGTTVDISEGGIKLQLDKKLFKETKLNIRIIMPHQQDAPVVEGIVVWSEESPEKDPTGKRLFHAGIRFRIVKEAPGSNFRDYIRSIVFNPGETPA
ncbi:MAG: PilZ domain-containing protein [Candidatus Omnitrophota bacterium]|nr:PilZ domain-containing protein [Candidatus Omnitrophota bacterium]